MTTAPSSNEHALPLNFCLNNSSIVKKDCYTEPGMVVYSSPEPGKTIHPELAVLARYVTKILKATLLKNTTEPTLVIDNLCDSSYLANHPVACTDQWL